MKKLQFLTLLVGLFLALGCSKKSDPAPSPNSPSTSSQYTKFKIGSTSYSYSMVTTFDKYYNNYDATNQLLNLSVSKNNISSQMSTIYIDGIDLDNITLPATFDASSYPNSPYVTFNWYDESGNNYASNTVFTVTITSKTNDIISGTFSGTIYDSGNTPYTVSNGTFKIKVTRV